ncbi:phosphotransferase enzyme family protein [Sporosarcina trichiuri]|uniref:phosphotransferase enzyme family protein n=1 Tax=Sporosarcina trichiuri TaxID=3056445 RepID=UPI0025B36489|nr:hypothetical protein [Sporosarcina sp. 0.2-SM1T-5]WJY27293.1 hypothetical protein QWT68_14825 [Sporosarcina sp. 0.2-SM1T-5]
MGITEQSVVEVLEQFGLQGTVSSIKPFIDYHSEADKEVKTIAKVGFKDRAPLVVKFLKEPEHPPSVIESQSVFSEYLRNCGIRTAQRYEKNGTYCLPYQWDGLDLTVTIEEYLGEEIKAIDFPLARNIGQLLGKIHTVSEEGGCRIGKETIFNFLGYNEVSGYDTFRKMSTIRELDPLLFERIKGIYEEKREAVQRLWNLLPRAATQGDISINNLTVADGTMGIFDYNIAGDATLVGDMVLQGLLTANEMPLAEGILEESRPDLFRVFCEGYCSERALTKEERMAAECMYSVASAFWFTDIRYDDDSLEQLRARGENERAERKLQGIYDSLQQDCPKYFNSGNSGEFKKRVKNT